MKLNTNSATALQISSSGNVGIGTTTPFTKLHVEGNTPVIQIRETSGTAEAGISMNHSTSGSHYNWFVGTLDGSPRKLTIGATVTDGHSTDTAQSAASLMLIDQSTGNVGIGEVSPSTKLDVSGVITATGGNSTNWNTAYGWGNHASASYITGNQTITLSGDVSGSGTTSISVSLAADSVAANEIADNAVTAAAIAANAVGASELNVSGNGSTTQFLRSDGDGTFTWATPANNYSLPAASSSERGGVKIGYTENGKNYPVEVSSEQMFVNVPWTNTTYSLSSFGITATSSELNYTDGVTSNIQTQLNGKQASGTYNTIIGTDSDINTSGATIIDNIYVTDGVITSMGTRALTLADLGYTGATNANNYVLPATISGNRTIGGNLTVSGNKVILANTNADVKYSVWSGTSYGIGMTSGVTYGGLNDFAMTFCMNNDSDRGFWWGYNGQNKSTGAMSLTTSGKLTVSSSVTVGTTPSFSSTRKMIITDDGTQYAARMSIIGTNDTSYPAIEFVTAGSLSKRTLIRHEGEGGNDYGLSIWTTNNSSVSEKARFTGDGDIEVKTNNRGIILKSPNGSRYRITINDSGEIQTSSA